MSSRILISLGFALLSLLYVESNDDNIKSVMELQQIVPDVIDEAPDSALMVTYESGIVAENGVELTPTQTKNLPTIAWQSEPDSFYTLLFASPDAPSRANPKHREILLWIVANIPGNDISSGEVIAEYPGIGPPLETGLHRYVFLLFKQLKRMDFDEEKIPRNSLNGRLHFSTRKFVEKHNLGVPVAGNFFVAQYDDYTPEVHKIIGYIPNA